jgi:hypothetical protein
MPSIPELLSGHVTLEVECLDRLYLNGYIGSLATSGAFMREQLGKPIPSPVVLGQISERFREAVRTMAGREGIPIIQFSHGEKKDKIHLAQQQTTRVGGNVAAIKLGHHLAPVQGSKPEAGLGTLCHSRSRRLLGGNISRKYVYAMKRRLLPSIGEKSGLARRTTATRWPHKRRRRSSSCLP